MTFGVLPALTLTSRVLVRYRLRFCISAIIQMNYSTHIPYTTYHKPMGGPPYISSEQRGGLIMRSWLIYECTIKCPIPSCTRTLN